MRSLLATAVAVLSVVVLGAACAAAAPGGGSPAPEMYSAVEAPPTVRVTNNNWSNMIVYAVRGGTRIRLGMVTSMATQVFRLPGAVASGAGGLRLLADPIGGSEQFLTPAVQVSRGEEVKLEIHNQLQISSVSVWGQR